MILHNRNRDEYEVRPREIWDKENLSSFDKKEIIKAMETFKSMKFDSENKIAQLSSRLTTVAREKGNCPEAQSLIFSIKCEEDFIRGANVQIERYISIYPDYWMPPNTEFGINTTISTLKD